MVAAAARQFLVTVAGIDGTFATQSGGEVTAEASKVYDGGSIVPQVIAAPPEVGDLTCGRPFDPDRDSDLLTALLARVGSWRTTVTKQPLYGDMTRARSKPRVYSDALLTGVTEPEVDASSGDSATLELTFSVGSAS